MSHTESPAAPDQPQNETPAVVQSSSDDPVNNVAPPTKRVLSYLRRTLSLGKISVPVGSAAIVVAIVIVGTGVGLIAANKPSQFVSAAASCGLENNNSARVGDDGASLTLDMEGEEDFAKLTSDEVFCVLDALKVPDSVTALMEQTRALDGRQTADWDGVTAAWSYHPDNGMDVILSAR